MKIQFTKIEERLVTVEITEEEYKNLYNEDYAEVIRATETGKLRPFERLEKVTYPEDDRNLKNEIPKLDKQKDKEEYYFDKKKAEGCYNISFSGLLVYIFDLNEDYGFVGFDEGHDTIKTTKTEIKYNEEGEPYLDFSHDEILLNEIVKIVK